MRVGLILAIICLPILSLPLEVQARGLGISLFATYGLEEKFDTREGGNSTSERTNFFGALFNVKEVFEVHALIASGPLDLNTFSFSFHRAFFKQVQPFVNVGLGLLPSHTETLHMNLDAGFQLAYKEYRFRIFHKSRNKFWGGNQYASGLFLFAFGVSLK